MRKNKPSYYEVIGITILLIVIVIFGILISVPIIEPSNHPCGNLVTKGDNVTIYPGVLQEMNNIVINIRPNSIKVLYGMEIGNTKEYVNCKVNYEICWITYNETNICIDSYYSPNITINKEEFKEWKK